MEIDKCRGVPWGGGGGGEGGGGGQYGIRKTNIGKKQKHLLVLIKIMQ